MNVWLVVGVLIVAIVVWLLMKMSASAKAINNYFCDASLVFGTTGDEAAKLAALQLFNFSMYLLLLNRRLLAQFFSV